MTKNIYFIPVLLLFVAIMFGCSGVKKPEGMPDLTPCTITLTQEGEPAANVMVTFRGISYDQTGGYPIIGSTDSRGKLVVKTQEKFSGIPSGEYVLVLQKTEQTGNKLANPKESKTYTLVEKKYLKKATSPLKLTVEKQAINETFEIGKAVREELKKNDFDF